MASPIVLCPGMGPKLKLEFAKEYFWDGKSNAGDLQKVAADLSVECLIVPELGPDVKFSYASHKAVTEYKEAKALGVDTVPVLVGSVSYLLSKPAKGVANDLAASLSTLTTLEGIVGKDKLVVSTSCSRLHTAVDLVNETKLDKEIKPWLTFPAQKVVEVNALAGQKDEVIFSDNAAALASRKPSPQVIYEAFDFKGFPHRHATNIHTHIRHSNFLDTFHSITDMDGPEAIPTQKLDKLLKCDHKWGPGQRCGGSKFFRIEKRAIPTQKLDKLLKCDLKRGPGQRCGGSKFFRIEKTEGDTEDYSSKMASPIVGYPRMGPKWKLELAREYFGDGKSNAGDLRKVAADLSVECFTVPELVPDVKFSYASHKAVREYQKAKALGVDTVPVLLGPVSSLLLYKRAKGVEESFSLYSLLGKILPIYKEVITELKEAGASCILVEERALVMGLGSHKSHAFTEAYSALEPTLSGLDVLIADIHAEQYKTLTSLKGVTVPKAVAAFKGSYHRHATNIHTHIRHFIFLDTFHSITDMDGPEAIPTQKLDKLLKCDHKWGPGQRCGGPKFFRIEETEGDTEDYSRYLPIEPDEEIGISPPAINRSPKTMSVKMMVNGHVYIGLIDTGSSFNFVRPRVAREAGLNIIKDDPIEVSIADGSMMCSEGRCPEFEFVIQGGQFATQAYIIQLGGCDVILGIQWLMGLGKIIWDFASLKMELTQGGKTIEITGMDTEDSEAGCSSTDEQLLPSTEEIADGINKMLETILWVNPDRGLKTRKYTGVKPPLKNKLLRSQLATAK